MKCSFSIHETGHLSWQYGYAELYARLFYGSNAIAGRTTESEE